MTAENSVFLTVDIVLFAAAERVGASAQIADTGSVSAAARKRVYRAAHTRHAVITQDCGRRLAAFVADPDARGAAALWDSPISLLDEAAVRALRDDLTSWLEHAERGLS